MPERSVIKVAGVCNCVKPTDVYQRTKLQSWGGDSVWVHCRSPKCRRCSRKIQPRMKSVITKRDSRKAMAMRGLTHARC